MESVKDITRYVIVSRLLVLLLCGLIFSGLRLWANVIIAQNGNVVKAAHIVSFDRTIVFLSSVAAMKKRDCREVIIQLSGLLKLYPHYWDSANNLAICYATIGKTKEAKALWEEILLEWPWHEASKKNLAEINKKRRR